MRRLLQAQATVQGDHGKYERDKGLKDYTVAKDQVKPLVVRMVRAKTSRRSPPLGPVGIESLKARHDVTKLDLTIHLLSLWCIDIDLSI